MGDIPQYLRRPEFDFVCDRWDMAAECKKQRAICSNELNNHRLGCRHKLFLLFFPSEHLHENSKQHPSNNYLTEQVDRQNRIEGLKI